MNGIVVDASVALAWLFPDEGSRYADAVLEGLEEQAAVVPALWAVEVANALLVREKARRISQAQIRRFSVLLAGLTLVQDTQQMGDTLDGLLPLAREHKLTAYDAAYLDLAVREGLPLATLDKALQRAAKRAGVPIFEEST